MRHGGEALAEAKPWRNDGAEAWLEAGREEVVTLARGSDRGGDGGSDCGSEAARSGGRWVVCTEERLAESERRAKLRPLTSR